MPHDYYVLLMCVAFTASQMQCYEIIVMCDAFSGHASSDCCCLDQAWEEYIYLTFFTHIQNKIRSII